jgi:hypothetical protein
VTPHGRAELPDWLFIALKENAATFGSRLGRILYDLDLLADEDKGTHASGRARANSRRISTASCAAASASSRRPSYGVTT